MTFTFEEVAGKRAKRGGGTPQPVNTLTPSPPAPQGGFRAGNRVQLAANFDGQGKGITDFGSAITKQGQDILSLAEAREQAIFEGELKIKDKQDKNATNELVDVFDSFTSTTFGNADQSSLDFSNAETVLQFNKKMSEEAEKALNDPRVKNMSPDAVLDLQDRIRATVQKSQDDINARSLSTLNFKGTNRFNQKAANLQDETAVNQIFDEGGDTTQYFINSFQALAKQSIGSVDFKTQAKFQRNALQLAQNTVFNYHMRNNEIDEAEDTLEDGKFDAVDGSITNQEHHKRIRDARSAPQVVRWDNKQNKNVNISSSEAKNDPNRYEPEKDMTKIDNINSYKRAYIENKNATKESKLSDEALKDQFGINDGEDTAFQKEMAAIQEMLTLVKDPGERAALEKRMEQALIAKAAPPTVVEEAERAVEVEAQKIIKKQEFIEKQRKNKKISAELMKALEKEFAVTPPTVAVTVSNSIRSATILTVVGRAMKEDEFLALDVSQREKILKVGDEAERLKNTPEGKGKGTMQLVKMAVDSFKKEDKNFLSRNEFLNTAENILSRREGGSTGVPAETPLTAGDPTPTADELNAELEELLATQRGIEVEDATGIGSAFSNFLTNAPIFGQLFSALQDQEVIRARAALLRVSREILVLTMKNDRFAMAEQTIITPLLSKPSLIVDAESVKTQMIRFQEELKIEIARSMRDIKAGIDPKRNLDKIVDLDRIDSMINQFNLTPPIDAATTEDIKNSSSQSLSNLQGSVSDSQLVDRSDKLDALIERQEREISNLSGGKKDAPQVPVTSEPINIVGDKEVNPNLSPEVQTALGALTLPQIEAAANELAAQLALPGNFSAEQLQNMEALARDLQNILNPQGQQ